MVDRTGTNVGETLQGSNDADHLSGLGGNDLLLGYQGDDTLDGGDGDDTIRAHEGDDTLNGGAGNDTLYGYEGADTLNGNAGDDLIFTGRPDFAGVPGGQFGSDAADGGDGTDTIVISWFNQLINGQYVPIVLDFGIGDFVVRAAGSEWETAKNFEALVYYGADGGDDITGSIRADFIQLGYGNDRLLARAGNDHIVDLGGIFDIDGGADIDTLELPTYLGTQGVTLRLQAGGTAILGGGYSGSVRNIEILSWDYNGGTGFNDYYGGGAYADEIHAGSGNDRIEGGDGDDKLFGGRGDDTILGGAGNDRIEGGGFFEAEGLAGSDTIHGGAGNDSIEVDDRTGTTFSYLYGEDGDDSLSGIGRLEGGAGNDGLGGSGQLFGGIGNDTLYGFAGSFLDGGDGIDTADYRRGANVGGEGPNSTVIAPLIIDLLQQGLNTFGAKGVTFVSIENIIGSIDGPSDLRGTDGDNVLTAGFDEIAWLTGRGGNDTLIGDSRPDRLFGGAGFDTLVGGIGNDLLDGGTNPEGASGQGDVMLGGRGDDTYYVNSGLDLVDEGSYFPSYGFGGVDTIISTADFYWDVASVGETISVAETVVDAGNDGVTIVGGVFNNTLIGHSKTDVIFGRGGSDIYKSGDGVDFMSLSTLGVANSGSYVANGVNTVVVEQRTTGANSYDIVFEFESGRDKLDVSDYGFASTAAAFATGVDDGAGNSYFILGDGLDYLYMVGLTLSELSAADFIV